MGEFKLETEMMVDLWKSRFKLNEWKISLLAISSEQVTFDDDVPEEDRYFIGILKANGIKEAKIFYDRPLTEEDIVHELIHVKHPTWVEDKVNSFTKFIMDYYNE